MISPDVTETDNFLDMSGDAQSLYFHLNMYADDDGLISNPKSIRRMMGANEDDLKALVKKGYLILFDDGVVAITHWRIHNTIRKDRYKPSIHSEDVSQLSLTDSNLYRLGCRSVTDEQPTSNQAITAGLPVGNQMTTNGIPTDDQLTRGSDNDDNQPQLKNTDKAHNDGLATNGIPTGNQVTTNGNHRLSKVNLNKTTTSTNTEIISKIYNSLQTEKLKQELMLFVNELGEEVVAFAIESMYENAEKPTFKYLRSILNRYKQQGLKSLAAVQHDNDVYNGKTVVTAGSHPQIPVYKLGE